MNVETNIEYAVMIKTRKFTPVFIGLGAEFIANPRNFSARFRYLRLESVNDTYFTIRAYASVADRTADVNRQASLNFPFASTPASNVALIVLSGSDPSPVLDITEALDWLTLNYFADVGEQSFTDEAIGLYDSVLCLVTGRLGYTEGNPPAKPPENPVTMEPQLIWKDGLIAKDSLGTPEEVVDPALGGGYSTMSSADLKLINNQLALDGETLFDYLNTMGINLFRCELLFFAVIDGVFELWGTYSIEDVTNEEHLLRLTAVDGFLTIHKETLKAEVSLAGFPAAPDDSQGKFIPLCIGRIPETALLPVTGQIVRMLLCTKGGIKYELAQIQGAYGLNITIKTGSKIFEANALRDKFIRVARAEQTDQKYTPTTISSNSASSGSGESFTVAITLSSSFGAILQVGSWVQVYDLKNFNAASDGPIHGFTRPLLGYRDGGFVNIEGKVINRFSSQGESDPPFADISGITARPEGDYAPYQPQDGFLVGIGEIVRVEDNGPGVSVKQLYDPNNATVVLHQPYPFGRRDSVIAVDGIQEISVEYSYPSVNLPLPNLTNKKNPDWGKHLYYSRRISATMINSQYEYAVRLYDSVSFNIPIPSDFSLDDEEDLSIAMDADFCVNAQNLASRIGLRVRCYARLLDIYGYVSSGQVELMIADYSGSPPFLGNGGSQKKEIRQVGNFYYDGSGSGTNAVVLRTTSVDFLPLLRDKEARKSIKGIGVQLVFEFSRNNSGGLSGTKVLECGHDLYQIALFRKRDTYTGAKYSYVTGVDFGNDWGEDRNPPRPAGNPVLSIPDAIEYLIRKRDDAGDKIDTASFDASLNQRFPYSWHVGRQVTEQKNSKDYITELCRHGFLCLVPGRDGKRRLVPLDGYDNPGIVATYDDSNILDGSVSDSAITGLDRVYTGLELRYDKNPATDEYRSTVYVRYTERETFPEYVEEPNAEWTKYVGGFQDYESAKACWQNYRNAYLVSHRVNIYKLDCDWFQSNARLQPGATDQLEPYDAAVSLAWVLSAWYSGPRIPYTFRVPLTSENMDNLQLLNRVLFRDIKRTGGLYYKTLVERTALDTVNAQIEVTVSRLATDSGYPDPEDATPRYLMEVVGGDTLTETIGGNTLTEIVNS